MFLSKGITDRPAARVGFAPGLLRNSSWFGTCGAAPMTAVHPKTGRSLRGMHPFCMLWGKAEVVWLQNMLGANPASAKCLALITCFSSFSSPIPANAFLVASIQQTV